MRKRVASWLSGAWVALGLLVNLTGPVGAQIDPTLFGDHLGPPIPDRPDTGDDWMVVNPEVPPATGESPMSVPEPESTLVPDAGDAEASEPETAPEAAASAGRPEKQSWFSLPWSRKKANPQEAATDDPDAAEVAGPRLGKMRVGGAAQEGSSVDSGLLPSELRRWKRDPRKAMQEARAERRLLLLWMTDSMRSSTSKSQAVEVFRHTQFLRLAKDYMVLTKLDFAEPAIASHRYTRTLKERLKVMGYPALILFSPDSEELWRVRGYRRGRYPQIIDDLRYQVKRHALQERDRHEKMLAKGYRQWTNDDDEQLFARALEVSVKDRTVLFVDDSGRRYHYPVVRLSGEDRNWLAEQFLR